MSKPIIIGAGIPPGSRSQFELEWVRNRPMAARPPYPQVGDMVMYRSNEWFEPIEARIEAVNLDPYSANMAFPDPWPLCRLKVFPRPIGGIKDISGKGLPRPYFTDTRESRLEGSPGWLPLNWENYPRPAFGGC